jgi:plastocyanin
VKFACVGVAILSVACGGSEPSSAPAATPAPASAPAPTDTADLSRRSPEAKADGPGTIAGIVAFAGTPPKPRPLPMDSDPQCVAAAPGATTELLVVGPGGGLKNVFVYVKDGLGARRYAVPSTPVALDQKGCSYIPHVVGIQAGQTMLVSNSDPLIHNVHAMPKNNREFNFGQPAKTPPVSRVFEQPEIGLPFKCDVHGWMNAYVNVVPHPFFAVTKDDGSFEIKGLPEGTYTLELWHERLGTQTQAVTVTAAAPAKVNASFTSASK